MENEKVSACLFDIVCVYNNKKILDDVFLPNFNAFSNNKLFNLHLVDNTQKKYRSAIAAFNSVLSDCEGKWILFSHQDVFLLAENWLEKCATALQSLENWAIVGVAGMVSEGKDNAHRGRNMVRTGQTIDAVEWWPWGNAISVPTRVQTVDEFLFIIPRTVLDALPFDEKTCDSWHLYAVDYALSAKIRLSLDTYVLPLPVYHQSSGIRKSRLQIVLSLGPLPRSYYETLRKVLCKYRGSYRVIYTTCSHWHTMQPLLLQRICKLAVGFFDLAKRKCCLWF